MYSAIYLPASKEYDPSADGFETRTQAERYVFNYMCKNCRNDRARALKNTRKGIEDPQDIESSEWGDLHPACYYEWLIIETEKLKDCKDLGDMFDAAGFERVKKENENG